MARNWKTIREEAVRSGRLDEAAVAKHRERMTNEVRAHKLADVRRAQRLTQVEVAELMHVTQSRVSRIEKGELDVTELGTLRNYVEALGGQLRLVADFGDEHLTVA